MAEQQIGDPTLADRVQNGRGRSAHFGASFYSVRTPQNRAITPIGWHPTSVLQQMMSSGIGYSERDRDRFLMGDHLFNPSLPTQNSANEATYQKSVWLRRPEHIPGDVLNGGGLDNGGQ